MEKTSRLIITALATTILALALPILSEAQPPVNLSGYEFLLGHSCTIAGQPAKCDVQFGGWTGGNGPVANGWRPFPGTEKGLWKAKISYIGTADFGRVVAIVNGSFDVLFKNGKVVSGTVTNGSVEWPSDSDTDIGCGDGVAKVSAALSGTATSFLGCLHDLPAGSVIPPRIWGTLQ
jgi:hypothetical protein